MKSWLIFVSVSFFCFYFYSFFVEYKSTMRQFIIENQKVKNGVVVLDGKDFRYLRQVLRVKPGDMLNVRFPDGILQPMTVASIDEKGKKITIQICNPGKHKSENDESENVSITRGVQADEISDVLQNHEYWLFQFIPKPQKFEQIVRQATECGVRKIIPVIGEYSEKSSIQALQNSKKERLERVIKEARQQSGSPVATEVLEPVTLEKALELWNDSKQVGFVLSERTDKCVNLQNVVSEIKKSEKKIIGIAVGSEGGISPAEIEKLYEKNLFYPIHFAVNILRCETAALYGIAAIQSALE